MVIDATTEYGGYMTSYQWSVVITVTLWNRADHYIFALWFFLSFFLLFFLA